MAVVEVKVKKIKCDLCGEILEKCESIKCLICGRDLCKAHKKLELSAEYTDYTGYEYVEGYVCYECYVKNDGVKKIVESLSSGEWLL